MFPSQTNNKNRRSVSALSQQNSKRSSMSLLNIQDSSIMNSHQRQPSYQANPRQNQQYELLWQQLLPGLKNKLIQSYRVVRGHVKSKNYMFTDGQLAEVYQGMSNGLKTLQKAVQCANKIKTQLTKRESTQKEFTSSYKMLKPQHQQQHKHITTSPSHDYHHLTRITQLQEQIQHQRQKNNQQIRLMIQNHEQEMMFVEQQQKVKITNIKKDHHQQIQSIFHTHKMRQEQIRNQAMKKVNQLVKSKFQSMKVLQVAKYQQLIEQNDLKQGRYKSVVISLVEKLKDMRNLCETLTQRNEENLLRTKLFVHKLINAQSSSPKNDHYLKILSQKLTSLLAQDFHTNNMDNQNLPHNPQKFPPASFANPQPAPMSYTTMAIQQMFMNGDDSIVQMPNHHNLQNTMQSLLEQLVWRNFFCQQNEQNVINLFNIARQRTCDENPNPIIILSHTLYPLIVQKIKLTLSKLYSSMNLKVSLSNLASSQNPTAITQFSTQNVSRLQSHMFPIRYRNIQSIEELEVSDSMICDENNDEKEKIIMESGNFENHSPIINYKGYATPEECDQSASFDVDLF